ncbi:MAG: metallophosphoesterase family protein [Candidatus Thorarchaeota archaeon]
MSNGDIRIAHIADLHFASSKENDSCYSALSSDIARRKPQVIVVTGDIADNYKLSKSDFRKCLAWVKKYLVELCKNCDLDPSDRLFVIPGNHDYRLAGSIPFILKKGCKDLFIEYFEDFAGSRYISSLPLIVGCFDSNTTNYKVNLATGQVLRKEFDKFDNFLDDVKKDLNKELNSIKKIALIHHHPLPVYRVEAVKAFHDREPFHVLLNGGTFLRELIKNGVRLIFHGHRHYRGVWKATYSRYTENTSYLGIITAGTAGKENDDNTYSYNIVDLKQDGSVLIDYRILRGEETYRNVDGGKNEKPFELFSFEESRLFKFRELKNSASCLAERLDRSCEIMPDSGELRSCLVVEGLISRKGPLRGYDRNIQSGTGVFSEKPKISNIQPKGQSIVWEPDGFAEDGIYKGKIKFHPEIGTNSVSFHKSINVPNAMCFVKEDSEAIKGPVEDFDEFVSHGFSKIAAKNLFFSVQFPPNFFPLQPRVSVTDLDGNTHVKEREYCQKRFHYSADRNRAYLFVDYPLFQHQYQIGWGLPSESDVESNLEQEVLGRVTHLKDYFQSLLPDEHQKRKLNDCAEYIYQEIDRSQFIDTTIEDRKLEICLLVFEEKTRQLRYVSHFCREFDESPDYIIFDERIVKGRPISGTAYKTKEGYAGFYVGGPSEGFKGYLRGPICKKNGQSHLTAIIAIPLFFPANSKNIVGILEFSSCSNLSCLLKLDSVNEEEKYKKLKFFSSYIGKKYLEKFIEVFKVF